MHFRGPVWRPPYESKSLLLQVTSGCTHDDCRFCSLYGELKFRMSPFDEIEADLRIAQQYQPQARRVFLTGANPMALSFDRLKTLAITIREYLPEVRNIGGFARITDFRNKTLEQLKELHDLGYDRISIGTESGDDITLAEMRKGYTTQELLEQAHKLEEAGIEYNISYLTGLAGEGNGVRNATASAELYSLIQPYIINVVSLTVFPDSDLYQDIRDGLYTETPEQERLEELQTFLRLFRPQGKVHFFANTVSNPVPLSGLLPDDREYLIRELQMLRDRVGEEALTEYRKGIRSL